MCCEIWGLIVGLDAIYGIIDIIRYFLILGYLDQYIGLGLINWSYTTYVNAIYTQ